MTITHEEAFAILDQWLAELQGALGPFPMPRGLAVVLTLAVPSYQALRRLLERRAAATPAVTPPPLTQSDATIRAIDDYPAFWEQHAQSAPPEPPPHHHGVPTR